MKKVKLLCLGVVLSFTAVTASMGVTAKAATTYTVKATGGMTLAAAVNKASAGDTIVIDGAVTSGTVKVTKSGITIKGINKAKVDFKQTAVGQKGLDFSGSKNIVQDFEVCNAGDNGIYVTGTENKFYNLEVHDNKDAGVQISNGGDNTYLYRVHSYLNADAPNGENADGFAVKLHSGKGIVLEECVSENNSDDGYDLYAAHGAVKFIKCQANNNGNAKGYSGDGNGFKLGGVDNKTPGVAAHIDNLDHYLVGCTAKGNKKNGFDRNNQGGHVTMEGCTADSNKGLNYNWPAKGTPSAIGHEVTFGTAYITKGSVSINGKSNLTGAVVTSSPTVK
ncbi:MULTISPECIES: right-handed parallel beta-helix repeat-containing protein [Clostridium]|uniref:Right-handed parallel beta-helix repeat-containing protein n=1 Tax=Clostridium cibarium TaxID=2762247 RepID=A0ABR8PVF0_9CLOT|nr:MULTISPECIES: right-handed parallel beta-helix repeat-containing protein [Clostridium]MBD7912152.1 right-handed parallel beta-helix repeat-containing protein [Clostridium cibarium]